MKKILVALLCLAMLFSTLAVLTVSAEEEHRQQSGFWIKDAVKTEEIMAQKAGESIGWEVPYLPIAPQMDGEISPNEYKNFRDFEDYISLMAAVGNETRGNTAEEFSDFISYAEGYAEEGGFVTPYWGWDGTYLYLAFEVQNMNGFHCDPAGGSAGLWAQNCLQVGLTSNLAATGRDFTELGFGLNSTTNEPITHTWIGNYWSEEGDFAGSYDEKDEVVIYECRIQLQKCLGLTDTTVQNGDQMKFAWLLGVNGASNISEDGTIVSGEEWQAGFCHGIGGPYSFKMAQYFATVTFTGLPDDADVPVVDIGAVSEDDQAYQLIDQIDFSKEDVFNTLTGENATVTQVTEDGETFVRVALNKGTDLSYFHSSEYPRNLVGAYAGFVAIKYRIDSGVDGSLGLVYRTQGLPQYNFEECMYETLIADGQWHVALLDMSTDSLWSSFILNMGVVPYVADEECAGGNFDIAFIKAYALDPYDMYEDLMYADGTETTAPEADGETTAADGETTVADTTAADKTETTAATDDGCASVVGLSAAVVMMAAAAAVVLKKKD